MKGSQFSRKGGGGRHPGSDGQENGAEQRVPKAGDLEDLPEALEKKPGSLPPQPLAPSLSLTQ